MKLTMVNPREIKTHRSFDSLFAINEEVLQAIEMDMKERHYKYDPSQPVVLATWQGLKEPVCIDGHTRIKAAISAGIESIPTWPHEFDTEEEALEYAIHLQCHRRNMSDADLLQYMMILDKRCPAKREASTGQFTAAQGCASGKSAAATAELLNTSLRKVEQTRTVIEHGGDEILESVKNGDMSINKGYQETQKKRRNTKPPEKTKGAAASAVESRSDGEGRSDLGINRVDDQAPCVNALGDTSVILTPSHYQALDELGGSITEHLSRAIDLYLASLDESDDAPTTAEK